MSFSYQSLNFTQTLHKLYKKNQDYKIDGSGCRFYLNAGF